MGHFGASKVYVNVNLRRIAEVEDDLEMPNMENLTTIGGGELPSTVD